MVKTYMKKPIPIEAIQWNGKNFDEIKKFCKDGYEFLKSKDRIKRIFVFYFI